MKHYYLISKIKASGNSIDSVADATGIKKGTLYSKIRGDYDFTESDIKVISKFLNLVPEDIVKSFLEIF